MDLMKKRKIFDRLEINEEVNSYNNIKQKIKKHEKEIKTGYRIEYIDDQFKPKDDLIQHIENKQ